jgi:Tol biopolymer transport system component
MMRPGPSIYQRLTFQRGFIPRAKFAPDGYTIVYSASYQGKPRELFLTRTDGTESRPLGIQGDILSISSSGQMAVLLHNKTRWFVDGTLAEVSLSGGSPREIANDVWSADWSPDGSKLAVVRRTEEISSLEVPLGNVIYKTPRYLRDVDFSPDGKLLSFNEHDTYGGAKGSVKILDLQRKTIISEDSLYPEATVWRSTSEVLISSMGVIGAGTSELYALNRSGKVRLIRPFPTNMRILDAGSSDRILATFSDSRTRTVGLFYGQSQEKDLSQLDATRITDVSRDGKNVVLFESGEGVPGPDGSVFLRKTDGSPAVLLGPGIARNLSDDGKFVLAMQTNHSRFLLLPIEAGEVKPFSIQQFERTTFNPTLSPDGKFILFWGVRKGHLSQVYIQPVSGGNPIPVSEEGVRCYRDSISQDGTLFIGTEDNKKKFIYPIEKGKPQLISHLMEDEIPFQWSDDGRSIYIHSPDVFPIELTRLELSTGKRTLITSWMPSDPGGVNGTEGVQMTPDEKNFVFSYNVDISTLYMMQGLK